MPNLTRREFLGLLGIGAAAAAVGVVGAPQVGGVDKAATGGYLLPEPYADRIVEAIKNGESIERIITVTCPVSQELLDDPYMSTQAYIRDSMGRAMYEYIDYEIERDILSGAGAGRPVGILGSTNA